MGRGEDDVADNVLGLQLRSAHPAATTTLRLERTGLDGLHVAGLGKASNPERIP